MKVITLQDLSIASADGDVQVRLRDEGGLSVGYVRIPAGADLRSATKGLPDDLCPCPHWASVVSRRAPALAAG